MHAADEAVLVPSYLDVHAVVAAAVATHADVVHPGYGFLSERAPFAVALAKAGIALAGPSAEVMELMGRKDAARDIALAAGVPVVPASSLIEPVEIPFPVLVKAAAGGGGKGMRVVRHAGALTEAVASAKREALSAFGDDTMLVEKYVESGRHIEVQVMADSHGTVLHLGERDCSAQRRHQKVLEESPAPTVDDATRARLHEAAVALSRQVGYVGAGTVEFLLDNATGEFYFLEMNTRLQVEHPVTEAVTGLDLVELQLLVADGQPLPLSQDDVRADGHAIEARVYAEDAFGGFLPQAGTTSIVRWPAERPRRPRPRAEPGREHRLRPDARQGRRPRARPRVRTPGAGAGARRHRDPRSHHQRRLPACPRGLRRVPRPPHRHRLARRRRPRRRGADARRRGAAHALRVDLRYAERV